MVRDASVPAGNNTVTRINARSEKRLNFKLFRQGAFREIALIRQICRGKSKRCHSWVTNLFAMLVS